MPGVYDDFCYLQRKTQVQVRLLIQMIDIEEKLRATDEERKREEENAETEM